MNLQVIKKEFKINLLYWGLPMFIFFNTLTYKDLITQINNKEFLNLVLDILVLLLLVIVGTIIFTIGTTIITPYFNKKLSKKS